MLKSYKNQFTKANPLFLSLLKKNKYNSSEINANRNVKHTWIVN